MFIEVTDNDSGEIIFEGEADEFLEQNEYDEEIEIFLNELDYECGFGESKILYGNFAEEFVVKKIAKSLYDEEEM